MAQIESKIIFESSDELYDLIHGEYLEDSEGNNVEIETLLNEYKSSGGHQEYHNFVFKVLETGKFYSIEYSNPTKNTMDWDECNTGLLEAVEVKQVKSTTYKYVPVH